MTIPARYSATCPGCGGRWQPGDLIRADEPEPGDLPEWRHAVCPAPLAVDHPVCPVCRLTHPAGACDR